MIRNATQEDAPWIKGIWNRVIAETTITFTTDLKSVVDIEHLIARQPVFVAPEQGFATYGPFRAGPGYRHVAEHTVYVSPDAQGAGLGRALMQTVEAAAATDGIEILIGGLSGTNTQALEFHQSLGFAKVAQMPGLGRKWGQGLDLVLIQKNLRDTSTSKG